MDKPQIACKVPAVLELDAGSYWWCACGLSQNQPFCDGSHKETPFTPMEVTIEAKIFGVGKLVESSTEDEVRTAWGKESAFINRYLKQRG